MQTPALLLDELSPVSRLGSFLKWLWWRMRATNTQENSKERDKSTVQGKAGQGRGTHRYVCRVTRKGL